MINKTIREHNHAAKTFHSLDEAMAQYYEITGKQLQGLKEPKLSDFYTPSEGQKSGELVFIAGGLGLTAFLLFRYA